MLNGEQLAECVRLVAIGLAEDLGGVGDVTTLATIDPNAAGSANFVARKSGVAAGLQAIEVAAAACDHRFAVYRISDDGPVGAGETIARVRGNLHAILKAERTALNIIGRLSGIATLTAKYVAAILGTKAAMCDTRKTTPGMRFLEKYAVKVGGGTNQRLGLFDAILVKDNHLAGMAQSMHSADPIAEAVRRCRERYPALKVEIEVDSLAQLDRALAVRPEIVLVDNFKLEWLAEAVRRRDAAAPQVLLEASGGIDLTTVRAVAETGVDRISVGALTHSAPNFDIGLDYDLDRQ